MKYKFGFCGHYGGNENFLDGQTVKAKTITKEMEKRFGKDQVKVVDTFQWKKHPIRLFWNCFRMIGRCEHIIILPADKGLKVFAPLFYWFNLRKRSRIHYSVIGGWLPFYLEVNPWLLRYLNSFSNIFVETNKMKSLLDKHQLNNVHVVPNFKNISIVETDDIVYHTEPPYPLCTFSRVTKDKGIEEAIDAVVKVNKEAGKVIYTLDVYGMIEEAYLETFNKVIDDSEAYVQYKGVIPYEESTDVLKAYYMLLFPTRHLGEGFAGTIIDAYSSGLPVIASDWKYNSEFVDEGEIGYLYDLNEENGLYKRLVSAYEDTDVINAMRPHCIERASYYKPDKVIDMIVNKL